MSNQHDPRRVLVVDDSAFARRTVILCFRAAGLGEAEFLEAGDGTEALHELRRTPIDMVITDLNMPNMRGDALVRRMRASPRFHGIPVVVVSSAASSRVTQELERSGANVVLRKPISGAKASRALLEISEEAA